MSEVIKLLSAEQLITLRLRIHCCCLFMALYWCVGSHAVIEVYLESQVICNLAGF